MTRFVCHRDTRARFGPACVQRPISPWRVSEPASRCALGSRARRLLGHGLLTFIVAILGFASAAQAEVTRVEVVHRRDLQGYAYEEIWARVHYSLDPADPRNAIIVDLDKAPRAPDGRVEFAGDVYVLRPTAGGNGVAIVDVVNRGRRMASNFFNRAAGNDVVGDGLLLRRGFTVVCVGWEFDVPRRDGAIRLDAPIATDADRRIEGLVHATFTPVRAEPSFIVSDLAVYEPVDPAGADSILTVRDGLGEARPVPRDRWTLAGHTVTLQGGFEPGRTYELAYRSANPPVGGVGFAAVRDMTAWLRHAPDAVAPVTYAYAFGISQCGRFLRDFLYYGFNTDEQSRQVFDGVMAHIAGAGRLDLNRRWATPMAQALYSATSFPFSTTAERDPVSGATDGLLDNPRGRDRQPKVFFTNTDVEYWGGGRSAALVHTLPDGRKDVDLPDNVRVYFFAGTQHGPGVLPAKASSGQQRDNPNDYAWILRALLLAMDGWVRNDAAPPASSYPRLDDGTLVELRHLAFPAVPGVQDPRILTAGFHIDNPLISGGAGGGSPLLFLVPQVDVDGNDRAGIRLPEIAVPLATYTGWNFRNASIGGTHQLAPLIGSYIPFPRTEADRERETDPRRSIAARYPTRVQYLKRIEESTTQLIKRGYLAKEDVPAVVRRAAEHWTLAIGATSSSTPDSGDPQ